MNIRKKLNDLEEDYAIFEFAILSVASIVFFVFSIFLEKVIHILKGF